jgi:hypothetical protein
MKTRKPIQKGIKFKNTKVKGSQKHGSKKHRIFKFKGDESYYVQERLLIDSRVYYRYLRTRFLY